MDSCESKHRAAAQHQFLRHTLSRQSYTQAHRTQIPSTLTFKCPSPHNSLHACLTGQLVGHDLLFADAAALGTTLHAGGTRGSSSELVVDALGRGTLGGKGRLDRLLAVGEKGLAVGPAGCRVLGYEKRIWASSAGHAAELECRSVVVHCVALNIKKTASATAAPPHHRHSPRGHRPNSPITSDHILAHMPSAVACLPVRASSRSWAFARLSRVTTWSSSLRYWRTRSGERA